MTITYDKNVDAGTFFKQEGKYDITLPLELDEVDLNLDLDPEGRVLRLEVLGMSKLFELIARYGGELTLPERVEDYDGFGVLKLFPKVKVGA